MKNTEISLETCTLEFGNNSMNWHGHWAFPTSISPYPSPISCSSIHSGTISTFHANTVSSLLSSVNPILGNKSTKLIIPLSQSSYWWDSPTLEKSSSSSLLFFCACIWLSWVETLLLPLSSAWIAASAHTHVFLPWDPFHLWDIYTFVILPQDAHKSVVSALDNLIY